jgi:hypothetical protein
MRWKNKIKGDIADIISDNDNRKKLAQDRVRWRGLVLHGITLLMKLNGYRSSSHIPVTPTAVHSLEK